MAAKLWPLFLLPCLLAACTGNPPRRFQHVPSGAVAYPGVSHYIGPFAFHRLYSILPGSFPLACREKYEVVTQSQPTVVVQSCHANSDDDMREIGVAIARSFSFLREASGGRMSLCVVKVALVDLEAGVQASDLQSLKSKCARLRMLGRWRPGLVAGQRANVTRSIVANAAHEAYHITLRREGPRKRDRVIEETEANIVGQCAAFKTLGRVGSDATIQFATRPEEADVDHFYHETLAGDRAAEAAIRSGNVSAIAAAAPIGAARALLDACAKVLENPQLKPSG